MASSRKYVQVIIPTFDRAALLPAAIESALAQDFPFILVHIIDDGSTDNTREVCAAYVDEAPGRVFYYHKANGGCASARNYGLHRLDERAGYVCFLDSDDRLLPGKLSREVELLERNPEADFTYSDSIVFDESTGREVLARVAGAKSPRALALEHFLSNEAKCSAILYRAEVLQGRRFREDMRLNEDSEFLQRVAIECAGVYSPEPGCWVRFHGGSKSRNWLEIERAVLDASLGIVSAYPEFHRAHRRVIDRRLQGLRRDLLISLLAAGRQAEAMHRAGTPLERFWAAAGTPVWFRTRRSLGRCWAALAGRWGAPA